MFSLMVAVVPRVVIFVMNVRTDTTCGNNDHLFSRGLVGRLISKLIRSLLTEFYLPDAAAAVVKTEPIEVPISENTENQVSDAQATVKTETSEEVSDDKPVDTDTSETVEVKKEADKDEEIKEGEKPDKEEESPNLEADDHHGSSIPLMPKPAAGGIRITITSQVEKLERRESMISTSSQADSVEESEFDPDAVVQEKKESQEDLKPRLKGKKLTEFPMQSKDSELSGLCSIM